MASADVLLAPTAIDVGGTVVLQAQAAGLPVLVPSAGGSRENLLPLVTGFICRADDESDFCWRIAELFVDRAYRAHLGQAAREYALSRTWTAALEPLFDCYRRLRATSGAESQAEDGRPPRPASPRRAVDGVVARGRAAASRGETHGVRQ